MISREVQHRDVIPGAGDLFEQGGARSVETVNGLVLVTHAEQVGIVAGHLLQQLKLQGVHVLGFVDEEGAVPVSKSCQHGGMVTQQIGRLDEEEVEVQYRAAPAETDVAIEKI